MFVAMPCVLLDRPDIGYAVYDWSGPDYTAPRPKVAGSERRRLAACDRLADDMNNKINQTNKERNTKQ